MFDVDRAAAEWLDELRRSGPAPEPGPEELRARLKDEMKQLAGGGLSSREAFYLARSRVTPGHALPEHCARAGAREVRRDRFRWGPQSTFRTRPAMLPVSRVSTGIAAALRGQPLRHRPRGGEDERQGGAA